MFKRILSLAVVATLAWGVQAKVKLSHLIGDNMVIQQQTDVRLWGWAKPNSTVTTTTSWSQQKSTTKAGKDGQFLLTVKSPKASYTPLSIVFDDEQETTAIESVAPKAVAKDNVYYDLQGRQVAQPTKGLYIVNGKKVAVQ